MTRPVMRRAALVVLLAAAAVRAQDGERLAEPHPLRAMLTETMRTQQVLALQRVVDAQSALHHAAACAYVDLDRDGRGEYATLPELLGLSPWRGSADPPAGVVGWGDAVLRDDGTVEASGYLFRVVLPDAGLGPAATLDAVDPDLAEEHAVVLAWPVRHGLSGRWSFGADANGAPLATDEPAWSGPASQPPADALLDDRDAGEAPRGLAAALRAPGRGTGGREWVAARGLLETLRADVPDLEVPEAIAPGRVTPALHWIHDELPDLWKAVCAQEGAPDGAPVPALRLATPAEIGDAIAEDLRFPMERTGQWERQKASFALVGAATPAKYVESERGVLLCPETLAIVCRVANVAEEQLADVLRLLVVHELAHALDFRRYPLGEALRACRDEASIAAWSAVVEGHAQQVTRRAADAMERTAAFAELVRLTSPDDDGAVPAETRAALEGMAFPYHDGERFLDAVREAWGDEGVAEVLRRPPTRPMQIETPQLYLARGRGAEAVDWTAVTAPLAGLEPPGAEVRCTPVLRRTLRDLLTAAPELDADAIVARIEDVESRVAATPDGRGQVASTVLLCADARAARDYVVASRRLQAAQDRAFEGNPLVKADIRYAAPPALEGVTAGYRVVKELRTLGGNVHGFAVSVAVGRWVVEAATTRLDDADGGDERRVIHAISETLAELSKR